MVCFSWSLVVGGRQLPQVLRPAKSQSKDRQEHGSRIQHGSSTKLALLSSVLQLRAGLDEHGMSIDSALLASVLQLRAGDGRRHLAASLCCARGGAGGWCWLLAARLLGLNACMAHTLVGGLCRYAGSPLVCTWACHAPRAARHACCMCDPGVAAPRLQLTRTLPCLPVVHGHRRRRCGARYRTRCAAHAPCHPTAGTQLYIRPAGQPPPYAPGCALLAYAPRRLERLCAEAGCCRSEHCSPNEACATTTPPHQQHSPRPATRLPSSSPHPYLVQSP